MLFASFVATAICGTVAFADDSSTKGLASGKWVNKYFVDFNDVTEVADTSVTNSSLPKLITTIAPLNPQSGDNKVQVKEVPIDGTSIKVNGTNRVVYADIIAQALYYTTTNTTGSATSNWSNTYGTTANKGLVVSSVDIATVNNQKTLKVKLDNIKVPVGAATTTNNYATIWVQD